MVYDFQKAPHRIWTQDMLLEVHCLARECASFVPINREILRSSAQRHGWQQCVVRVVAKVLLCIESDPQLRQLWDKMGGDIEPG